MLPPDGVLLMRVRPCDGPPFALAFTADELEAVFGEVPATQKLGRPFAVTTSTTSPEGAAPAIATT